LRIKIDLESLSKHGLVLPRHHNYLIQGFIYRNLSKAIATKAHDQGYKYGKREFRLIKFQKETVIKTWSGIYPLKGLIELIKLAFDWGLGAKNSQGFGMIEKWNRNRREQSV